MREPSHMIVYPKDKADVADPKVFLDNLKASEEISIQDVRVDDDAGFILDLLVDEKTYNVTVYPMNMEIPPFVRPEHVFTEDEYALLDQADTGLNVCIEFDDDYAKCFHDQLRIIDAMFPDILAVLDCPSEKILSGKWVSLAASSKIHPSPRYLFTVQAISGENDEVWLHSHGMKRCGMYELEMLCSTKEMCNIHYRVIETFAFQMLEAEEDDKIKPGDAVFVAQAENGPYIVCTAVDWKEALKFYPEAKVGTEEDRQDDVHSEDTCVLMMYRGPADEEKRRYTRIQEVDNLLNGNPMFMMSNSETERMRSLALERIPYLKEGLENKENQAIVKIGLITDKGYWGSEEPQREHIWFEIKEMKEDSLVGELTQEPFYVSGIKAGDTGEYPFSDITDWLIYTKEGTISPDDAYRLI